MSTLLDGASKDLRQILDLHPAGIVEVGLDGSIRMANAAACDFFGLSFDSVTHRHVPDWEGVTLREDGSPCPVAEYPVSICLSTGQSAAARTMGVRRPDGEIRWAIFRAEPLANADGSLQGAVVMLSEITERIRAEQERDKSVDQLTLMLENLPATLYVTDRNLKILSSKGRALDYLGIKESDVVGLTLEQFVAGQDPDGRIVAMHRLALDGESVSYSAGFQARDFRVFVEPARGADGAIAGCVGISFDVTDLETARREVERLAAVESQARERAEAAVQARDTFVSIAAHELRTPLAALRIQVQGLVKYLGDQGCDKECPRHLGEMLTIVERQSSRIAEHVNHLLDVTRISSGGLSLQPRDGVDLAAIARDAVTDTKRIRERDAVLIQCEAPEPVIGSWDEFRLSQVVMNLLTNAVKYGQGRPVIVRVYKDGDAACLEVEDQGSGIAPGEQEEIFKQFGRSPGADHRGGLGLGLYIAREIVTGHRGRLTVESEPGKGSIFRARIPCR